MYVPLVDHMTARTALTPVEQNRIQALPRKALARREVLSMPGDRETGLVFVETGILRLGGIDGHARDRTYQFALEGWWMADWTGFHDLAQFEVQAVEASQVVVLSPSEYEGLLGEIPRLEGYFRQVFQRAWAAAQRRNMLRDTNGAEVMYREFVHRYPDFVQRVPQYMLASFLGFSPEFLSRIRAQRS